MQVTHILEYIWYNMNRCVCVCVYIYMRIQTHSSLPLFIFSTIFENNNNKMLQRPVCVELIYRTNVFNEFTKFIYIIHMRIYTTEQNKKERKNKKNEIEINFQSIIIYYYFIFIHI